MQSDNDATTPQNVSPLKWVGSTSTRMRSAAVKFDSLPPEVTRATANVLTADLIAARAAERRVLSRQQRIDRASPSVAKLFVLHWLSAVLVMACLGACFVGHHPPLVLLTAAALLFPTKVIPPPPLAKLATCSDASHTSAPFGGTDGAAVETKASKLKKRKLEVAVSWLVCGRDPSAFYVLRRSQTMAIAAYAALYIVASIIFQIVHESSSATRDAYSTSERGPLLVNVTNDFLAAAPSSTTIPVGKHLEFSVNNASVSLSFDVFAVEAYTPNYFFMFGLFSATEDPYRFALAFLPPIGIVLVALMLVRLTPPRFIYYAPKEEPSAADAPLPNADAVQTHPDARAPETPIRRAPRIAFGPATLIFVVASLAGVILPTFATAPLLVAASLVLAACMCPPPPKGEATPSLRIFEVGGGEGSAPVERQVFLHYYLFDGASSATVRLMSACIAFTHYWCIILVLAIVVFQNPTLEGANIRHNAMALQARFVEPAAIRSGSFANATGGIGGTIVAATVDAVASGANHSASAAAALRRLGSKDATLVFAPRLQSIERTGDGGDDDRAVTRASIQSLIDTYARQAAWHAHYGPRIMSRWLHTAGLHNVKHYFYDADLRDSVLSTAEIPAHVSAALSLAETTVTATAPRGSKPLSSVMWWDEEPSVSRSPRYFYKQDIGTRAIVQVVLLAVLVLITRFASASPYHVPVEYPRRKEAKHALHVRLIAEHPDLQETSLGKRVERKQRLRGASTVSPAKPVLKSAALAPSAQVAPPEGPSLASKFLAALARHLRAVHRAIFRFSPYITPVALVIFSIASPTVFSALLIVPSAFLFAVASFAQMHVVSVAAFTIQTAYTVAIFIIFAGALWDIDDAGGSLPFKLLFFGESRQLNEADIAAANFQLGIMVLCNLVVGFCYLLIAARRRRERATLARRTERANFNFSSEHHTATHRVLQMDDDSDMAHDSENEGDEPDLASSLGPAPPGDVAHFDQQRATLIALIGRIRALASAAEVLGVDEVTQISKAMFETTSFTPVDGTPSPTDDHGTPRAMAQPGREANHRAHVARTIGEASSAAAGALLTTLLDAAAVAPVRPPSIALPAETRDAMTREFETALRVDVLPRIGSVGWQLTEHELTLARGFVRHSAPSIPAADHVFIARAIELALRAIPHHGEATVAPKGSPSPARAAATPTAAVDNSSIVSDPGDSEDRDDGCAPQSLPHGGYAVKLGAAVMLLDERFADAMLLCATFRDGGNGVQSARDHSRKLAEGGRRVTMAELWRELESLTGLGIPATGAPRSAGLVVQGPSDSPSPPNLDDGIGGGLQSSLQLPQGELDAATGAGSSRPDDAQTSFFLSEYNDESFFLGTLGNLSFSFAPQHFAAQHKQRERGKSGVMRPTSTAGDSRGSGDVTAKTALAPAPGTDSSGTSPSSFPQLQADQSELTAPSTLSRWKHAVVAAAGRFRMSAANFFMTVRTLLFRLLVVDMILISIALFLVCCYRRELNVVSLVLLALCIGTIWMVAAPVVARRQWFSFVIATVMLMTSFSFTTAVLQDEVRQVDGWLRELLGMAGFESSYWELGIYFALFFALVAQHGRLTHQCDRLALRARLLSPSPQPYQPSPGGDASTYLRWDEIRGEIEWRSLRASDFFAKLQMYCVLLIAAPIFLFLENFETSTYIVALFLILFILLSCVSTVRPSSFQGPLMYRLWFIVAVFGTLAFGMLGVYQVPQIREWLRADLASRATTDAGQQFLDRCSMYDQRGRRLLLELLPSGENTTAWVERVLAPFAPSSAASGNFTSGTLAPGRSFMTFNRSLIRERSLDGWLNASYAANELREAWRVSAATASPVTQQQRNDLAHLLSEIARAAHAEAVRAGSANWTADEHRSHSCLLEIGLKHEGDRTAIATMASWFVVAFVGVMQFVALRNYFREHRSAQANQSHGAAVDDDDGGQTIEMRRLRRFVTIALWFVGDVAPTVLWILLFVATILQKSIASCAYLVFFLLDWRGRVPLLYSAIHLLLLYAYPLTFFPEYWSERGMLFVGISKNSDAMSSIGSALIGPALVFLGTQLHANTSAERRRPMPPFDLFNSLAAAISRSTAATPSAIAPASDRVAWQLRRWALQLLEFAVFMYSRGFAEFGYELLMLALLVSIAHTPLRMEMLIFALNFAWFVLRGRQAVRGGKAVLRLLLVFYSALLVLTYWFAVRTPYPDSIDGGEPLFSTEAERIDDVGAEDHKYSYVRWVGGHPSDVLLATLFVLVCFYRLLLKHADAASDEKDVEVHTIRVSSGRPRDEETREYVDFTDVLRDFSEELRLARRKNLTIDFVVPTSSTHPDRRTVDRLVNPSNFADGVLAHYTTLFIPPVLIFVDGITQTSVLHLTLLAVGLFVMRFRHRVYWSVYRVWPKLLAAYSGVVLFTALVNIPTIGRAFVRYPDAPAALGFLSSNSLEPMELTMWRVFAIWSTLLHARLFSSFAFLGVLLRIHQTALDTNERHDELKRVLRDREKAEDEAARQKEARHRRVLDELRSDFAAVAVTASTTSAQLPSAKAFPSITSSDAVDSPEAGTSSPQQAAGAAPPPNPHQPAAASTEQRVEEALGAARSAVDRAAEILLQFLIDRTYRGTATLQGLHGRGVQLLAGFAAFCVRHTADACIILFAVNFVANGSIFDGVLSFAALTHGAIHYPWPTKLYWMLTITYICVGICVKSSARFIAAQSGISASSSYTLSIIFVNLEQHEGVDGGSAAGDLVVVDIALDFACMLAALLHLWVCEEHGVYRATIVDDVTADDGGDRASRKKKNKQKKQQRKTGDAGAASSSSSESDTGSVGTELETDSDDERLMLALRSASSPHAEGELEMPQAVISVSSPMASTLRMAKALAAEPHSPPSSMSTAGSQPSPSVPSQPPRSLAASVVANITRISGCGRDNYTITFILELCALFYSMFAYFSLAGRSSGSFLQSIEQNLLPGPLVLLLLFFVLIMVTDRILYTLSASRSATAMLGKFVFHVVLMAVYHAAYIVWIADVASQAAGGAALMMLKVLYGMLAAHQLRYGYPLFRHHDPFTRSAHNISELLYVIYRQIPFVWDLRMMLDWSCTRTTLPFASFLKVEDVGDAVYRRYARRKFQEKTNPKKGTPHPIAEKFVNGIVMFAVIMVIMFFPLFFYSGWNPRLAPNPITAFEAELAVSGGETLFTSVRQQTDVDAVLNDATLQAELRRHFPAAVTREFVSEQRDTQVIELAACSRTLWTSSPTAQEELMRRLRVVASRAGASSSGGASEEELEQVTLQFVLKLSRGVSIGEGSSAKGAGSTEGITTQLSLDPAVARRLHDAINASLQVPGGIGGNVASAATVRLPGLYDPMVYNTPSSVMPYWRMNGLDPRQRSVDCALTLRRELDLSAGTRSFVRYFCLECQGLFSAGNGPTSDVAYVESACRGDAACIRRLGLLYDDATTPAAQSRNVSASPTYVVVASDRVPSDVNILPVGAGIVALYTGLIFALSSVIRAALTGMAHRVVLEEVADPQCLAELIAFIYLSRGGGSASASSDLELEETLYLQLVDLLRSPELLLRRSGQQSRVVYNPDTGDIVPIRPMLNW